MSAAAVDAGSGTAGGGAAGGGTGGVVDPLIETLRLIGHPLRFQILSLLATGEHPVGDLVAQTAQGASLISQQLAMLRRAGLVRSRREAKQVFYTLVADKMLEVAQALAQLAGSKTVSLVPGQPAEGAGSSAPVAPVSQSAGQITAAMFAQVQPRG